MKKSLPVVLTALLASSSIVLIPSEKASANFEIPKQNDFDSINTAVNNDLEIENEIITFIDPNEITPQENTYSPFIVVEDGPIYTWDYVNTTYGNNVLESKVNNFLVDAFKAGLTAVILKKVPTTFFPAAASTAFNKLNVPKQSKYWYTVKKWKDEDAINVYFKYDISYYSDSARTKLIRHVNYVEKATY